MRKKCPYKAKTTKDCLWDINRLARKCKDIKNCPFDHGINVNLNKDILKNHPETGFTKEEQLAHDKLMESYEAFLKLDVQHPSELSEIASAIHIIQGILTTRICRRLYPKNWPTYKEK